MDLVSIISQAIADAIGLLLSGLVLQGIGLAIILYDSFISNNLLTPTEAFPYLSLKSLGGGEGAIYSFIMFNIYDPLLTLLLSAIGILYLLNSSLELRYNLRNTWLKVLLILILSNLAFFISQDIILIGSSIYSIIYNYGGVYHNFHEGANFLSKITIGPNLSTTVSVLVIILVLFMVLFLMITLSIRLAIIYTFPLLIPLFTLFLILPQTRDLGVRIWWLFIDAVFSPILMGIPLILATYSNNSSLILGFLALSDSIPFILMKEPSFIGNLGLIFGMSAEATANRTIPMIRSIAMDAKGAATFISSNTRISERIIKKGGNNSGREVRNYSSRYTKPPTNDLFFRRSP